MEVPHKILIQTISVTLAYDGISITIFFKAPALECILYDTWSSDIFQGTYSTSSKSCNASCFVLKEIVFRDIFQASNTGRRSISLIPEAKSPNPARETAVGIHVGVRGNSA